MTCNDCSFRVAVIVVIVSSSSNLTLLLQFEGILPCCTGEEQKLQHECCKVFQKDNGVLDTLSQGLLTAQM